MRTRYHALIISALCVASLFLYWLGAAIIALTTFKQGVKEGTAVWLFSLIPAVLVLLLGKDPSPLLVISASYIGALVVHLSGSWPISQVVSTGLVALFALLSLAFGAGWLEAVLTVVTQIREELNASLVESGSDALLPEYSRQMIVVSVAGSAAFVTTLCLFLGRSMHAALDKPGAFGQEFRAFQFPVSIASLLFVFSLFIYWSGMVHQFWMFVVGMPLFFSGLSCVHAFAFKRQRRGLLVFLYLFVVLVSPVSFIVMMALGFIDSLMDLRKLRVPSNTH